MKTAIEILVQDLEKLGVHFFDEVQEAIDKAREIEKEQIIEAYKADCDTLGHTNSFNVAAEQYYNKTFKSE